MTARLAIALVIAASLYRLITHHQDWPELLALVTAVIAITHFVMRRRAEAGPDEDLSPMTGSGSFSFLAEGDEDEDAPALTLHTTMGKGRRGLSG